jgi:hypothetical protein
VVQLQFSQQAWWPKRGSQSCFKVVRQFAFTWLPENLALYLTFTRM